MQRIRQLAIMGVTLTSLLALGAAPALAEQNANSGGSSGSEHSGSQSGGDTPSTTDKPKTETEPSSTETNDSLHSTLEQLREQAKEKLQAARENHQEKTAEEKLKICEQHKDNVDKRVTNFAAAGERHLTFLNGVLTKVENFYTSKNLTVTNYDSLVAAANAKGQAATAAVDALKSLDVQIDCSQPDPAQSVQTVKSAVSDARSALQAYRSAIKDLITAIKAVAGSDESTTGGNQ